MLFSTWLDTFTNGCLGTFSALVFGVATSGLRVVASSLEYVFCGLRMQKESGITAW